jgi:plasmid maintenance system antidote protein VapI
MIRSFHCRAAEKIYLREFTISPGYSSLCLEKTATALRLARFFNMSPRFWLGLQMDYDLDMAEDQLAGRLDKEVQVYRKTG